MEPAILIATVQSLMRMKRAEQTVRLAAAQWQGTFDAIREGVALLDADGKTLQSNAAYETVAGSGGSRIAAAVSAAFERLQASGQRQSQDITADEATLAFTLDPVPGASGELTGGVLVVTDVTEKRRFDEQLRQTARLESIGVLAGGIAHDFNNLLTGILGNSSLLIEILPPRTAEHGMVAEIMRASESAADLTRQILAYSGKGKVLTKPVDLSAIALETRAFVRRFIPSRVELIYDVAPDPPLIMADPSQMQQLTMNLVINAAESFSPEARGEVRVETRVELLDEGFFRPEEKQAAGTYLSLIVSDTGSGMDAATQARIFDPFFTTKFAGRGLGLSAVHGILQGHGGFLRLDSKPGKGTTFHVYFPATSEKSVVSEEPQWKEPQRGSGTILIVDDESVVRNFARRALENLGYQVLLAEDGRRAVELLRTSPEPVGLVILDLTMPTMEAGEALDQLRRVAPSIPVILSSGFNHSVAVEPFSDRDLAGFLGKPYSGSELAAAVEKAIRGLPPLATSG